MMRLVDHASRRVEKRADRWVNDQPDPVTGMWTVAPHWWAPIDGSGHIQAVECLDSIVQAVHLIPKFGEGLMPGS